MPGCDEPADFGDGGIGPDPDGDDGGGGCCRVGGSSPAEGGFWLIVCALGLLWRRRR